VWPKLFNIDFITPVRKTNFNIYRLIQPKKRRCSFVGKGIDTWNVYTYIDTWNVYTYIDTWNVYTYIDTWNVYTYIDTWNVYTYIDTWNVYTYIDTWNVYTYIDTWNVYTYIVYILKTGFYISRSSIEYFRTIYYVAKPMNSLTSPEYLSV